MNGQRDPDESPGGRPVGAPDPNRMQDSFSLLDGRRAAPQVLTDGSGLSICFMAGCACHGHHVLTEREDVVPALDGGRMIVKELRWETRIGHRQGCSRQGESA